MPLNQTLLRLSFFSKEGKRKKESFFSLEKKRKKEAMSNEATIKGIYTAKKQRIGLFGVDAPAQIPNPFEAGLKTLVAPGHDVYIPSNAQHVYLPPTSAVNYATFTTIGQQIIWELGDAIHINNPRHPRIEYTIRNTSPTDLLFVAPVSAWGDVTQSLGSAVSQSDCREDHLSKLAFARALDQCDFESIILKDEYMHQEERGLCIKRGSIPAANVYREVTPPPLLPYTVIEPLQTIKIYFNIMAGAITARGFNFEMLSDAQKYVVAHEIRDPSRCFSNPAIAEVTNPRLLITGVIPNAIQQLKIDRFFELPKTSMMLTYHVPCTQYFYRPGGLTQGEELSLALSQFCGVFSGLYILPTPANPTVLGQTTLQGGLAALGDFYQGVRADIIEIDAAGGTVTQLQTFNDGAAYDVTNFNLKFGGANVKPTSNLASSNLQDFEFNSSGPAYTHSKLPKVYASHSHVYPFSTNFNFSINHGANTYGLLTMAGDFTVNYVAPATIATPVVIGVHGYRYMEMMYRVGADGRGKLTSLQ